MPLLSADEIKKYQLEDLAKAVAEKDANKTLATVQSIAAAAASAPLISTPPETKEVKLDLSIPVICPYKRAFLATLLLENMDLAYYRPLFKIFRNKNKDEIAKFLEQIQAQLLYLSEQMTAQKYTAIGNILYYAEHHKEAISMFSKALKLLSNENQSYDFHAAYANIATCLLKLHDATTLQKILTEWLSHIKLAKPKDMRACNVILAFLSKHDTDKNQEFYDAITVPSDNDDPYLAVLITNKIVFEINGGHQYIDRFEAACNRLQLLAKTTIPHKHIANALINLADLKNFPLNNFSYIFILAKNFFNLMIAYYELSQDLRAARLYTSELFYNLVALIKKLPSSQIKDNAEKFFKFIQSSPQWHLYLTNSTQYLLQVHDLLRPRFNTMEDIAFIIEIIKQAPYTLPNTNTMWYLLFCNAAALKNKFDILDKYLDDSLTLMKEHSSNTSLNEIVANSWITLILLNLISLLPGRAPIDTIAKLYKLIEVLLTIKNIKICAEVRTIFLNELACYKQDNNTKLLLLNSIEDIFDQQEAKNLTLLGKRNLNIFLNLFNNTSHLALVSRYIDFFTHYAKHTAVKSHLDVLKLLVIKDQKETNRKDTVKILLEKLQQEEKKQQQEMKLERKHEDDELLFEAAQKCMEEKHTDEAAKLYDAALLKTSPNSYFRGKLLCGLVILKFNMNQLEEAQKITEELLVFLKKNISSVPDFAQALIKACLAIKNKKQHKIIIEIIKLILFDHNAPSLSFTLTISLYLIMANSFSQTDSVKLSKNQKENLFKNISLPLERATSLLKGKSTFSTEDINIFLEEWSILNTFLKTTNLMENSNPTTPATGNWVKYSDEPFFIAVSTKADQFIATLFNQVDSVSKEHILKFVDSNDLEYLFRLLDINNKRHVDLIQNATNKELFIKHFTPDSKHSGEHLIKYNPKKPTLCQHYILWNNLDLFNVDEKEKKNIRVPILQTFKKCEIEMKNQFKTLHRALWQDKNGLTFLGSPLVPFLSEHKESTVGLPQDIRRHIFSFLYPMHHSAVERYMSLLEKNDAPEEFSKGISLIAKSAISNIEECRGKEMESKDRRFLLGIFQRQLKEELGWNFPERIFYIFLQKTIENYVAKNQHSDIGKTHVRNFVREALGQTNFLKTILLDITRQICETFPMLKLDQVNLYSKLGIFLAQHCSDLILHIKNTPKNDEPFNLVPLIATKLTKLLQETKPEHIGEINHNQMRFIEHSWESKTVVAHHIYHKLFKPCSPMIRIKVLPRCQPDQKVTAEDRVISKAIIISDDMLLPILESLPSLEELETNRATKRQKLR